MLPLCGHGIFMAFWDVARRGQACWVHSELLLLEGLKHVLVGRWVGLVVLSSGSQSVLPRSAASAYLGTC